MQRRAKRLEFSFGFAQNFCASRDGPFRRCRRSFFSPPDQSDEPSTRITEHPLDTLQRAKAREGICVRQSAAFD